MANNLSSAIPELIADKLQKMSSQFDEGQKLLDNYAEASNTLKNCGGMSQRNCIVEEKRHCIEK